MSAPALRPTAPTGAVARHYLRLLARERGVALLLLPFALMVFGSVNATGFAGLMLPLGLAFLFPLYQWQGGGPDALDEAMPLDAARHRRIRVVCGAAWAALALAVCVVPYTALVVSMAGWGGYPAWYPLVLFGWGLAYYLFGSAVLLRAERPGRALAVFWLGASTLAGWVPAGLLTSTETAEELRAAPWQLWVGTCLLALVLAASTAWVAASPGLRLPRLSVARRQRTSATAPAARGPARALDRIRRPASLARVLWIELRMMGHDARWGVALAVLVAAQAAQVDQKLSEAGARYPLAGRAQILVAVYLAAFFWPLLVWMDNQRRGRELAEAVPAGMAGRRLMRMAAGAAWLALLAAILGVGVAAGAARAGVIGSLAEIPAGVWAGFPLAVLMMYLLGSIPLLLSRNHPVQSTVVWYLVFTYLIAQPAFHRLREGRFSPGAAILMFSMGPPREWIAAVAVWLPLVAAAAMWALYAGVRRDRREGSILRYVRPSPAPA